MMHPVTRWAQRKDRVFVEIPLMDITNEKIELTSTHLQFTGTSAGNNYALNLELFDEVNSEESKWTKTGYHLFFVLEKKNHETPFWTRLVKPTAKNQYIQVDWSKWVDEDQEEEDPNKGLGGLDPAAMQGFGGPGGFGMPGMGGPGGFGMPGMGGPGMGGLGDEDDEEGNLDDLEKQEELQPKKKQEEAK